MKSRRGLPAALVALVLGVTVVATGVTVIATDESVEAQSEPTLEEKVDVLWADFCERRPTHEKCQEPPPPPPPPPDPDPTPDPDPDPCTGVQVNSGQNLKTVMESTGPATFCVAAGTYNVASTGITLQAGDTINGEGNYPQGDPSAADPVVKIVGSANTVFNNSPDNVTLRDLDITDGPQVMTCSSAPSCPQMAQPGTNWLIRNVRAHDIDNRAFGGSNNTKGVLFDNVEIFNVGLRFNNGTNNGFSAAIKMTDGYEIRNSFIHDNNQGIWCDRDCDGDRFTVVNNLVLDNASFGIHYEQTYFVAATPASALIQGNTARGNAWNNPPGPKSDIGVVSAVNAQVLNNVVGPSTKNPQKNRGIVFHDRGEGPPTGTASGNTLNGDTLEGCSYPGVTCTGNN